MKIKIDRRLTGDSLRYLISGGLVTIAGTTALTVLIKFMNAQLAFTLIFIASFIINIFSHSLFVFKRSLRGRLPLVILTLVLQYLVGVTSLSFLLDVLHVPRQWAPTANLFICTPINFLLARTAFHSKKSIPAKLADITSVLRLKTTTLRDRYGKRKNP